MVIVSHDREFLDQLCTKVVETERGVSTTYKGDAGREDGAPRLGWAAGHCGESLPSRRRGAPGQACDRGAA